MKQLLKSLRKFLLISILLIISFSAGSQIFMNGYPDSVFTEYFRLNSGGWTAGDADDFIAAPPVPGFYLIQIRSGLTITTQKLIVIK